MSTKERKKESMNERLKDIRRNPGWQRGTLVKSDGAAGSHSCPRHVSCVPQLSLSIGYRDKQTLTLLQVKEGKSQHQTSQVTLSANKPIDHSAHMH
jgi:hypothetical protein